MRLILLAFLLALSVHAAEPPATPSYPLWDGQESIEQYAKRAGVEPNKTLDLGNGVKLEMVLIPAGKFVMGTPEPEAVDEAGFQQKILVGQIALAVGGLALLAMIGVVTVRAIRRKGRFQFSLGYLIVMVLAASVGVWGGTRWWEAAQALAEARTEYAAAVARFKDADDWEKPAHEATLTKPYYLSKFEVTQEQYQQVMGTNPSHFKGRNLPVECISWTDPQVFCEKASAKTEWALRLPTGAEWEYACRAGTRTTYCTGDTKADLDRAGWYDKNSGNTIHPVGQKAPNAWGVYDMHGNVWEWCEDWWQPYKAEAVVDPQGPAQGRDHVVRGGSWANGPRLCRSASLYWYYPGGGYGFRVAVEVPPKAP